MIKKPTQHDMEEFESFARAALGKGDKAAHDNGGPSTPPLGPKSGYIGHHTTTRNQRDEVARQLSGKHGGNKP